MKRKVYNEWQPSFGLVMALWFVFIALVIFIIIVLSTKSVRANSVETFSGQHMLILPPLPSSAMNEPMFDDALVVGLVVDLQPPHKKPKGGPSQPSPLVRNANGSLTFYATNHGGIYQLSTNLTDWVTQTNDLSVYSSEIVIYDERANGKLFIKP